MEPALAQLGNDDWTWLLHKASALGFLGLFARNLGWVAGVSGISPPILPALAARRQGQLMQQIARKAAARSVADALQAEGIPFLPIKGVVLAEEIYGDLSLRAFRDFDVLVTPERLDDAYALLVRMGYRMPHCDHVREWVAQGAHAVNMAHPDGSGVDLHWSIAPDVVDARRIRVIWEHSRPPRPGASLPGSRLSPEMTLVHLAKHFHSHQYRAPKPLVDFYVASRVLRHETSAQALFAAARSLGLVPVVDVAIRLCERSFLPGSLAHFAEARPPTTSARLARVVISDRFMIEADERARVANWLRYLVAAGGVRAAWESIVGLVVPSRLLLMQFFNRPVNAFSYALYYWRQLKKVVTLSNRWTG